jgi:hypothetical protein
MGRFSRFRRDSPPADDPLLGDGSGRTAAHVGLDLSGQPPPLDPPARPTPPRRAPKSPTGIPDPKSPANDGPLKPPTNAGPPKPPATAGPPKPPAPAAPPKPQGSARTPTRSDPTPGLSPDPAPKPTSGLPADPSPKRTSSLPTDPSPKPKPAPPRLDPGAGLAASTGSDVFEMSPGRGMGAGYRDRARLRRRLRYLRRARELAFRDLGGFVFDAHRFDRRRDDIVAAKLKGLGGMDIELRSLESALDDRRELMLLHEPGISVCPRCATLHASDANFCSGCGLPRGGAALPLGPRAPLPVSDPGVPEQPPATSSGPAPGTDQPASPATRP